MPLWKIKYNEIFNSLPKETKTEYSRPGIYGVYCQDILLYVGESKNMLQRWINHQINTQFDYGQRDYQEEKYRVFREIKKLGLTIEFRALEFIDTQDKSILKGAEHTWIELLEPPLNGGRRTIGDKGDKIIKTLKENN